MAKLAFFCLVAPVVCTWAAVLRAGDQPAPAVKQEVAKSEPKAAVSSKPAVAPAVEPAAAKVEVKPTEPPTPKIAFRTSADGVTRPLSADVGSLVKLSDDGFGLTVEKKGDDTTYPTRGDMVTVHYTGKLRDGTVFDSSYERKEPITFQLGRGKVIRGWDQGIITMSLGERGVLHIPSYKGYGSSGAPPAIPPNADLDFDVELLAINNINAPGYQPPKPEPHSGANAFSLFLPAVLFLALFAVA